MRPITFVAGGASGTGAWAVVQKAPWPAAVGMILAGVLLVAVYQMARLFLSYRLATRLLDKAASEAPMESISLPLATILGDRGQPESCVSNIARDLAG